jgi:hypothetical protein
VATLLCGLPGDGRKSTLEEGVVYNITFMVFALNDPVTGPNIAHSKIGRDRRGFFALRGAYQKWSAGAKGHSGISCRVLRRQNLFQYFRPKKGIKKLIKSRSRDNRDPRSILSSPRY